MRAATKAKAIREKKAAPGNRGYGDPKAVGKGKTATAGTVVAKRRHDPAKHPRDERGRFVGKEGGGAAGKTTTPKPPRAPKVPKEKAPKPPAKPKPPKKVGTAKQRKGLADQVRAAKAGAKTPEARRALLTQVRDLRAKRAEWKRGQGKTQVEKLPKPPKPVKPPKAPKETKPKVEKKPKETKPPKEPKTKVAAKGAAVVKKAAAEVVEDPARVAAAARGDLRAEAELLVRKKPAEMEAELVAFVKQHRGIAFDRRAHGMAVDEPMYEIRFGPHHIRFPKGESGARAAAGTARNLVLGAQLHPEVARHTDTIYLTNQKNSRDGYWEKAYNTPGFESAATGGDGNIVVYHGAPLGASTFAHEAGHNLAASRYGSTHPSANGDFIKAGKTEKHPTAYAEKSPAEDFADSVRLYTIDNTSFKATNPLRYAVIDRIVKERAYRG